MNIKHLKSGIFLSAGILLFISCSNMSIPQSVSVKTDATYSANFGSYSKNLSDYFSADSIKEQIAKSSTSFSVYDYNPGSNAAVQHFLIKYPAMDKSIDISDQLDSINIGTNLDSKMGFNQSFTVPKIDQTFSNTAEQDIYSAVNSKSTLTGNGNIMVPDRGRSISDSTDTVGLTTVDINISGITFTSIYYRSGSLDITLKPDSLPAAGFKLLLTATLYQDDGTTKISSSSQTDVSTGGTLSIPLSTNPLTSSMKLKFTGSVTGSTAALSTPNLYTYAVSAGLTDAEMSKITGLKMTPEELGPAATISFSQTVNAGSTSSSLVSAEIGGGSLILQTLLPEGWSGVSATSAFSLSGGLTAASGDFTDTAGTGYLINKNLALAGKTYTPSDISISGSTTLNFDPDTGATIIFPQSGTVDITTTGSCSITSFTSATVNLGNDVQTSYTYETAVPDELKDFVTKIDYSNSKIGVSFNYINGLPTNTTHDINNITVKAVSTFMNMTGTDDASSKTLTAGTTTKTSTELVSENSFIDLTKYSAADSKIDITVDVALPGATTEHPTYVTVSNIEPGSSYSLSMSDFALVFDWSAITINSSSLTQSATDVDTGLNFSTLLAGVTDGMPAGQAAEVKKLYNMKFNAIPVYLYISKPVVFDKDGKDIFEKLNGTGKISLTPTISGTTESPVYLLGTSSGAENITFPTTIPTISEDSSGTVISNLATLAAGKSLTEVTSAGLPNILTSSLESLKMSYAVSMSDENGTGLTIPKSAVDSLKESGGALTISAVVYIDLPLDLTTSDDISVDVMKLADKSTTDDLLGRSSALNTSDYQKYLDALKNITLGFAINNSLGLSKAYAVISDNTSNIFTSSGEKLYFEGSSSFSLTGDQISNLLQTYPYMPTVTLSIPANTNITIPRDADLSIGLSAKITTDGTIQLYGGNN
ncbi:MAG: hypothetical protein M0P01_05215 [Treponema sp.]|nr:hypothetical protein [Treponema sp.]